MRLEFSIRNRSFEYEILIFSTPSHHNCNFDPFHALNLYIRSMSRTTHPPHLLHAKKNDTGPTTIPVAPEMHHVCIALCFMKFLFFIFSLVLSYYQLHAKKHMHCSPHFIPHLPHTEKKAMHPKPSHACLSRLVQLQGGTPRAGVT